MRLKAPALRTSLLLALTAMYLVVAFVIFRPWLTPAGFDIYYYGLQVRSLDVFGELLFADSSAVYRVLQGINRVVGDPLLATRILTAISAAVAYFALLSFATRGGVSWYRVGVVTLAVCNPAVFYLQYEFAKNTFALALLLLGLLLMTRPEADEPVSRGSVIWYAAGIVTLILAALSHRITALVAGLFVMHLSAGRLLPLVRKNATARHVGVVVAILAAIGVVIAAVASWSQFNDRLADLAWAAPVMRIQAMAGSRLSWGERLFYLSLQIVVPVLVPVILIRKWRPWDSGTLFAIVGWVFVFPFLGFSWDGIGFRLLILAPIFVGLWLCAREPGRMGRTLGIVAIVVALGFTTETAVRMNSSKGPDYALLARQMTGITDLARGRRLIAHRGLAGYLWYEHGIWTENFTPATGDADRYSRIVYGFTPEILDRYLDPEDAPAVKLPGPYTLVAEVVWQRFYAERRDLSFLKSELNPWLPRPVSGFAINTEAAAALSPVSQPVGPEP